MGRYQEKMKNGNVIAWGYDRSLNEYFIQLEDSSGECIWAISNYFVMKAKSPGKLSYSNSELLKVFQEYSDYIPKKHIDNLALDIKF